MELHQQILNEHIGTQQIMQKMMDTLAQVVTPEIRVYTIAEVAKVLKCKERAVKHHLYESHDLPYLKVGREVRIREEDLKTFLENQMMFNRNH